MQVGDLVKYVEHDAPPAQLPQRGIVVDLGSARSVNVYVIWYTCGNKGWWSKKHLKVISPA